MGINIRSVDYVVHYGPPRTADAFLQETGRAAREKDRHGHSILMTFPRMCSGRPLDGFMKSFSRREGCLRQILLNKFNSTKPTDQQHCCNVCDKHLYCHLVQLIESSFEESITESFSDSDSLASIGEIEEIDDI